MRYVPVFSLWFAATAAFGQSPAERIGPLLSDGAIAVVRIDLTQVSADSTAEALQPYLPFDIAGDGSPVRAVLKAAQAAGGDELFVVLDMADVPEHPVYLVAPGAESQPFESVPFESKTQIEGARVAGSKRIIERLQAGDAKSERPGLAAAFAAVADSPVQVLLVPSVDQRRILRELLPDLPEAFGGASGRQIAAGWRWVALGVTIDPQLAARAVVQSESEPAAAKFKTVVEAGLRHLARRPQVVKAVPSLPAFAESLSFQQEEDRLRLSVGLSTESAAKVMADLAASARRAIGRRESLHNLKRIALALHTFHDRYDSMPPSASYDGDKPLLSWRVYVLPFLDQQELYEQFHLDEPWDSEHNKTLIEKMPAVFDSPTVETPAGHTVYLAPFGAGIAFEGRSGVPFKEFTDGTSNTILVVEATAEQAVPWTKPADLAIDPQQPLAGLKQGRESFAVLLADGSAFQLSSKNDPKVLLKMLTRAGGEILQSSEILR